jgi:hypothetical protein
MPTDNSTSADRLPHSDLGQKEKIQILLSEYSTLRSEILIRTGYGFQVFMFGFAIVTWLLKESLTDHRWYIWVVLGVTVVAFGIAVRVNSRELSRAAHRVKELEHEINSRADEHLLVWETLSGVLTRMGIVKSYFSRLNTLPRAELPTLDPSYLGRSAKLLETEPGTGEKERRPD